MITYELEEAIIAFGKKSLKMGNDEAVRKFFIEMKMARTDELAKVVSDWFYYINATEALKRQVFRRIQEQQ